VRTRRSGLWVSPGERLGSEVEGGQGKLLAWRWRRGRRTGSRISLLQTSHALSFLPLSCHPKEPLTRVFLAGRRLRGSVQRRSGQTAACLAPATGRLGHEWRMEIASLLVTMRGEMAGTTLEANSRRHRFVAAMVSQCHMVLCLALTDPRPQDAHGTGQSVRVQPSDVSSEVFSVDTKEGFLMKKVGAQFHRISPPEMAPGGTQRGSNLLTISP